MSHVLFSHVVFGQLFGKRRSVYTCIRFFWEYVYGKRQCLCLFVNSKTYVSYKKDDYIQGDVNKFVLLFEN